ncbi:hypothetical protein [Patiriisocius marinus]|uniref:hypothetical protein n=1 Tax=Patiriisocius marinus TaxID=1397112 RepID=UPI00232E8214|nr:hypothetical protein [Patiriisocius marinus]
MNVSKFVPSLTSQKQIKDMKKSICIVPFDDAMAVRINAARIINAFRTKGFGRDAFVQVVGEINEDYKCFDSVKMLYRFWDGRLYQEQVNIDLDIVLSQLKAE